MKSFQFVTLLIFATLIGSCGTSDTARYWQDIGSLDVGLAKERAKSFLVEQRPELSNVEIKFVQLMASYHPVYEPSLTVIFVHANSFKPIEENQTLGTGDIYGLKYYMEMLEVEFSAAGVPIELSLNESLLGKDEQKSRERFLSTYNSY
jgi:hypothetical protein